MQDSRRQGIGRTLIHQTIEVAKLSFDWLHVRTTNPVAAQFYQSLDFMPCHWESATHTLNLITTPLDRSWVGEKNTVQSLFSINGWRR
jgi:hypothetical protein